MTTYDIDSDADGGATNATQRDSVINLLSAASFCGLILGAYTIWWVVPSYIPTLRAYRVDLPLPTKLVLAVAHSIPQLFIFLGGGIFLIEFVRRRQSRNLAIAVMLAVLTVAPIAYGSIMLPINKIEEQLKKK